MGLCTWDPDCGISTTLRKASKNKNLAELEKAAWYRDAFEDIDVAKQSRPKPPPESLFNLDKDRSIRTIHLRNDDRLPPTAGEPHPLQKKPTNEVVNLTNSDEESASSSSDDESRSAATKGDEYSPSSSAEENGQAPDATNGGCSSPATLPCPRGGHSDRRQVVRQNPGAGSAIGGAPQGGGIYVHLCLGEVWKIDLS